MKIKSLFFALILLATGVSLSAQNAAPIQGGNISASSTNCSTSFSCVWESVLPANAGTTTINLAGTFTATLLIEESNNGGQTWSTAATLSSVGTTTYSTNGFTDIRVRCSAYTSGTANVTISTGLLQVQSVVTVQSSSGGGSPNANTIYAWASKYNLPPPAIWVCDATYNSTTTVTTPATDPPFTIGTTYPVAWGYGNVQCGGNPQFPAGVMTQMVPNGATATATGAHTLTLSSAALGNCTGGLQGLCSLVVGQSAYAAINAAYTDAVAAGPGATLVLPAGGYILDSTPTGGSFPCTNTGTGNDTPCGFTVMGQGPMSTTLLLAPGLTFPNHIFYPANTTSNGVIFLTYHDFGVVSMSPEIAGQNNQQLFTLNFGGEMYHTYFMSVYPQNGNSFTCVQIIGVQNAITSLHDSQILNGCGVGVSVSNSDVNVNSNWLQGSNQCLSLAGATRLKTFGNRISLCGTNSAVSMTTGVSDWETNDTALQSQGTTLPVVNISGASGTVVRMHNTTILCAQTTGPAITVAANNTLYLGGQQVTVTCTQGSSNAITNAGTLQLDHANLTNTGSSGLSLNNSGTLIVGPGNNFGSGITNTGTIQIQSTGSGGWTGSCTGVVTSAATVGLYNLGQTAATTCTSTTVASGQVMSKPGTVYALYCTATAGNQATDACTVVKNGVAQTMTCSLNAVASCTDGTVAHQVAYVQGDILSIEVIGGTATTLANVKGTLVTN